jgi:CBS domain-containing protein
MKAADIMTRRVVTMHVDTPVRDAVHLMLQNDKSGLRVSVVVWEGTVYLWDTITDEAQRRALTVLAENVEGVGEERDHLVLAEPISTFIS